MKLARPERFELPTPWFVAKYSIQLSYGRVFRFYQSVFGPADPPASALGHSASAAEIPLPLSPSSFGEIRPIRTIR